MHAGKLVRDIKCQYIYNYIYRDKLTALMLSKTKTLFITSKLSLKFDFDKESVFEFQISERDNFYLIKFIIQSTKCFCNLKISVAKIYNPI